MNMSMSTADVSSSEFPPRNIVGGASTSSSLVEEKNNGPLLGPCFGPLARHMVPHPDTFDQHLNGDAPRIANNNGNRKSKKKNKKNKKEKKEKISNDRRLLKEEYQRGWSGNVPNLTSTPSGESNSTLEKQIGHRKRPFSASHMEGDAKKFEGEEALSPKRSKFRFSNTNTEAAVPRALHNDSGWLNISNPKIGWTSTPHTEADWSGVSNAQIDGTHAYFRSKSLCVRPVEIFNNTQDKPEPKTPRRRKSQAAVKLPAPDEFYKKPFQQPTIDHFCLQRKSQGVGPELELVREAQPARCQTQPSVKTEIDSLPSAVSGKYVPKPKAAEGANPASEGWTSSMAGNGHVRVLAATNDNNTTSWSNNSVCKRSVMDLLPGTAGVSSSKIKKRNFDVENNADNENRNSKREKKEKIPNDRRTSKDEYLSGWSGNFPNLTSTHSGESNSDLEQETPAGLRSLGPAGRSIFPREKLLPPVTSLLPLKTTSASTVNNPFVTSTVTSPSRLHPLPPSMTTRPPQQTTVLANKEREKKQVEGEEVFPPKRSEFRFSNTNTEAAVPRALHNDSGWLNISNPKIGWASTPHTEADWSGVSNAQINGTHTYFRSKSLCVRPVDIFNNTQDKPEPKTPRRRKSQAAVKLPATDEMYLKPFQFGWKRELVLRHGLPARGDVYFISPGGKKLRSRHDIIPLLQGDLTIDHFCFQRKSLGVGPEFELVREAQPARRKTQPPVNTEIGSPPSVVSGIRVPKPKAPEGAKPSPVGLTPTTAFNGNARVLAVCNGNNSASSIDSSACNRVSNLQKLISQSIKTSLTRCQMEASILNQRTPNSRPAHCVRCQSAVENPHERYKVFTSDSEGVVYICVRCAKKANAEERQPTYDNAENEVAANEGELHAEMGPLPVTEPISIWNWR